MNEVEGSEMESREFEQSRFEGGSGRSSLDGPASAGLPRAERERKSLGKEDRKMSKEDSDYVRDSTETTSSGGSSSTSGYVAGKVRRVPRAVRNKNTEVRRNPVRVKKKKSVEKELARPRQRLLTAKRKAALGEIEYGKRGKLSTMPYMNTRSVTRKMYNVGATYQAPTKRDETEWKEWPVHGMHERPIFHPQVGLAAEYLGKYFTNIDGYSYREILEHPEIEVVSVDPRSSSLEKKRPRKAKLCKSISSPLLEDNESFISCMHNSLHCVLGYCSQVVSPGYQSKLSCKPCEASLTNESPEIIGCKPSIPREGRKEGVEEKGDSKEPTSKDSYGLPVAKSSTGQTLKPLPRLFPMQTMYVTNCQKSISFTNVKTLQATGIKVQEVLKPSLKNPLILVNASEAKNSSTMRGRILKPVPNNLSLIKLDNNYKSNPEESPEFSPMYKSQVSNENSKPNKSSARQERMEFSSSSCRFLQEKLKKPTEEYEPRAYGSASTSKTWATSDASEIAKILSDYNKTATKTSNEGYASAYSEELDYSKGSGKRNLSIKFPQGKWRRFHFTVEKMKKSNNENTEGKMLPVSFPGKHVQEKKLSETIVRGEPKSDEEAPRVRPLQELLENTAMLYCAATGVHQDDLAEYIDSLDSKQSVQWLEEWNNPGQ